MSTPLDPGTGCRVAKLVGADFELGNFIRGLRRSGGTGPEAARALLAEIDGVPSFRGGQTATWSWGGWSAPGGRIDPQDRGRKFLRSNGGCAYIDLDHLELCIPEVRSAFDHAAASAAMLRLAEQARTRATERLPEGQSVQVLVNNSDGRSNSYGSHLNFLVSRPAWNDLFERRPQHLQLLASHQLSSLIYSGQGKVGAENGRPAVDFQISQRADFMETVAGPQTTYRRPLVNSRDESLCGSSKQHARLHVIFYDNTLCPGASVLKVGAMQIVLALLEAGCVAPELAIEDPVGASVCWSHDPDLRESVPLVDGRRATAVEMQERILEKARLHADRWGFADVDRAEEILDLWQDTLEKLAARDFDSLTGRLDWVLKRRILEQALDEHASLDWDSPELKHLDHLYGSLDPCEGLYWQYADSGLIEPWTRADEVARFTVEPPHDTRAWTRTMLLRRFDDWEIERVDWDRLTVGPHSGGRRFSVEMDDPLGFTRAETAHLFEQRAPEGDSDENP